MNLGERQAYETGRKDGWQEAIVALASGAKKLLGPETIRTLLAALQVGMNRQPAGDGDPTEPASWDGRMPVSLATGMVDAHRALIQMESAPGVARDEAHRDFVHQALAPCPNCRHQAHLPKPCLNMASDHGCDCGGTRPGDEDRHTVGEHR